MKFPEQAFILCAGKGTRLAPLTLDKPKCLLDIAGEPVIGRILEWLKRHEIKDVFINLYWKGESIKEYLSNHDFGMTIHYSEEEEIMGTAGGIRHAIHRLGGQFLIVYGDILTNMNLYRMFHMHHNRNAALTMASYRVTNPWECGVILAREDGEVVDIWEKPDRNKVISDEVNAGVMVCKKSCFDLVPENEKWDIARDLIPKMLKEEWPVYHMPLRGGEWLIDMGTRKNYERACDIYKEGEE